LIDVDLILIWVVQSVIFFVKLLVVLGNIELDHNMHRWNERDSVVLNFWNQLYEECVILFFWWESVRSRAK